VVRTGRTGKSCPGSNLGAAGTAQGYCRPGQVSYGKGLDDTAKHGWSLSTVANLPQGGPGNTTKHQETHIWLVLPVIYPTSRRTTRTPRLLQRILTTYHWHIDDSFLYSLFILAQRHVWSHNVFSLFYSCVNSTRYPRTGYCYNSRKVNRTLTVGRHLLA
ncbi:hypothetical protein EDB83DRAFT_2405554, partial [Lactarius deliciosus]